MDTTKDGDATLLVFLVILLILVLLVLLLLFVLVLLLLLVFLLLDLVVLLLLVLLILPCLFGAGAGRCLAWRRPRDLEKKLCGSAALRRRPAWRGWRRQQGARRTMANLRKYLVKLNRCVTLKCH